MYLMKEFKDGEGYKRALDDYRKLQLFHIDSPKVIAKDDSMRTIIQEYIFGVLASEQEITEFFLPRDLEHHCLGCYACLEDETKCPFF